MRYFTGEYDRTLDGKNRFQIPAPLRSVDDFGRDGRGFYFVLGEHPWTLWGLTSRGYEALGARIRTEFVSGPDAGRFEREFYGNTHYVELDKQGRIVLPDRLVRRARLTRDVTLVGCRDRFEIWSREAYVKAHVPEGEEQRWPEFSRFLRMAPGSVPPAGTTNDQ